MPSLASSDNQLMIGIGSKSDTSGVDKAKNSIDDLGGSADNAGRKSEFFGKAAAAAKVAVAALGVAVGAAGIAAIKSAGDFEQNRVAFDVMLGSADKAKALMADIADFAQATPFELPEVVQGSKSLLAFGIAADQIIPTMRRLGDVSAGIGAPIGEIAELYGKAKVQGRLFMEDINQLTGRGIPIFEALSKVTGKATGDIRKMVEDGKIGFPELEKAFQVMTDSGSQFGGMMDKQSKTFNGVVSNIQDGIGKILRSAVGMDTAGEIIEGGFFDRVKDAAESFLPAISSAAENIGPIMQKVMARFDRMAAGAGEAGDKILKFVLPAVKGLGDAIKGPLLDGVEAFIKSDFVRIVGGVFVGAITAAIYATTAFVSALGFLMQNTNALTPVLVGMITAVVAYRTIVGGVEMATKLWAAAQVLLNGVMMANPVMLMLAAVAGLTTALIVLTGQSDGTTSATDRLTQARQRSKDAADAAKLAEDALRDAQLGAEGAALAVERAQNSYNDAVARYGPNSLEAREAAYNLKTAQERLADANKLVADKAAEATKKQKEFADSKEQVKRAADEIGNSARGAAAGFESLANSMKRAQETGKNSIQRGDPLPLSLQSLGLNAHAAGTQSAPGGWSVVGEEGPELMNVRRGATILPADETSKALGGGRSVTIQNLIIQPQTYDAGRGVFDMLDNDSMLAGKGLTVNGGAY